MRLAFQYPQHAYERFIALITGGPFCHVEALSGDMGYSSDARDGGVRWKTLDRSRVWNVIEIPGEWTPDLLAFCAREAGCPYDYLGAITSALYLKYQSLTGWFCSEMVATVANAANESNPNWNQLPTVVNPNALYRQIKKIQCSH